MAETMKLDPDKYAAGFNVLNDLADVLELPLDTSRVIIDIQMDQIPRIYVCRVSTPGKLHDAIESLRTSGFATHTLEWDAERGEHVAVEPVETAKAAGLNPPITIRMDR